MSSNGVNVPLRWKISVEGSEEAKRKLVDLDQQFSKGQISISQYAKGQRESLRDVRALNNEQNVQKQVFLASNPALNSFSKSMSTVGAVSNTLLGITNAINLAQLASIGVNGQVTAAQQELATAQRQYMIDLRDYPNDIALHQADLAKIAADQSNLAYVTKEATFQQVTAWITLGSSVALISNSIVQAIPKVVGMVELLGSAQLAERFGVLASAISSVGVASLGVLGPIGLIAAALYGVSFALINILPGMSAIIDQIKQQFGVNTLEAYLISPFYIWYKDLQILGGQVTEWAYNVVNGVINAFNVIPKTINSLHIPGISLGTIPNVTPPGFTGNGFQAFADEQSKTTQKADDLVQIWTTATNPTLQKVSDGITQSNSLLTGLVDSAQQANQRAVYQSQLQTNTNQAASIQAQISQLNSNRMSMPSSSYIDQDTNIPQLQANIAANNASIDAQIKPLQDKLDQLEVGNQAALTSYLGSIGLSGDYGIGSVVSGALGGASAGWTKSDVDEFIKTHDYGVFTRAAIRDSTVTTPTHDDQINAWMKATGGSAADAKHALGYKSATGFDGIVSSATSFIAGESGAERVNIRPVGSGSSSGEVTINNYHFAGSLWTTKELQQLISDTNKSNLKMRGFRC